MVTSIAPCPGTLLCVCFQERLAILEDLELPLPFVLRADSLVPLPDAAERAKRRVPLSALPHNASSGQLEGAMLLWLAPNRRLPPEGALPELSTQLLRFAAKVEAAYKVPVYVMDFTTMPAAAAELIARSLPLYTSLCSMVCAEAPLESFWTGIEL